jgi:FkbM family methyltransferase
MEKMSVTRDKYAVSSSFLPSGVKDFLESFRMGRLGLRGGRKAIRILQALQLQRKLWMRQFGLPLRNVMLFNRPLTISFGNIQIRLVPRGQIASFFWTEHRFENIEIEFILNVLEPGMIFFDAGANVGLFTISAAKKIGGKCIFAFEPCASTYALLKQNVQLNGLPDVNVAQIALGDAVGEGVLQVNVRGKDGLNTLGRATHSESKAVGQEEVTITTLDVFMKDHDISHVDVMKVDIEGGELMLFQGARELLERADAPLILYESGYLTRGFGYHPVEIIWFLESCGYTVFTLNSKTGEIGNLNADCQYDSMMIAAKPGHPAYLRLREAAR